MLLIDKAIKRYGGCICMILMLIGTIITEGCAKSWYQSEEPEGFSDFIKNAVNV